MASKKTNIVVEGNTTDQAMSPGAWTFTAPLTPEMIGAIDNAGDFMGNLSSGGVTDDRQPEFQGRGTPGDTIVIRDNGTEIGKAKVAANGLWSFTPSTDMREGLHAITLVASNPDGEESAPSAPFNFEIDVTPPNASQLSITGVTDTVGGVTGNVKPGATTDDARPLLSGTSSGVPGHTVIVMVKDANGERELGHAVIGDNGNWTLQVDAPLAEGLNVLRVFEQDMAGNETALTAPYRVTVDTDTIAAPVIQSVQDDVGTTEMLQQGDVTNDTRPTFAGTAQAGATVKFYDGATQIGEVVADASGTWSFTPEINLADGAHTVTATATNLLGQTSDASAPWDFTVDTVAPAAPTIVSVADDVGSTVTANMAAGTVTDDARPGFKGKAEADSTVVIYDKGVEIDRVQANASGDWAYTPATPLADGAHSITVAAIDVAGNVSAQSAAFGFTVDTVAPGVPTLVSVTDDVAPQIGNVAKGGFTNDTKPTLAGKAEAGSTVVIYDKGVKLDTVLADASGNWSYTPATALSEGVHSITVAAMDKAGNTSAQSAAFGFTVDTVAPNAVPVIVSVADDVGPVTGNLANGATTDDTRPAFAGTATANATVVIFDKGVEIARVKADALGKWAYTPATAFSEGAHSVAVAHTDAAGNIGAKSPAFALTVATAAPTVPTLVSVTDDVAPQIGNVAKDGFTNDTRPALAGKADAGSTVTIYDKGVKLDSVLADASGNWSYTPATALTQGVHTITVVAANQAGITSAPSAAFGFTVDSVAPTVPTLVSVTDDVAPQIGNVAKDGFTNDTRPTLAGKAEAGSTVTIYDKGVKLGTALADASGNWSYTPATALSDGAHTITVAAADKAGNTSAQSTAFGFTVDTKTPTAAPAITGAYDDVGASQGNVANGGLTDDRRPVLSGTGEAGLVVTVKNGSGVIGTATVGSDGKWSLTLASDLALGNHSFTATQAGSSGIASASSSPYALGIGSLTSKLENFEAVGIQKLYQGVGLTTPNGLRITNQKSGSDVTEVHAVGSFFPGQGAKALLLGTLSVTRFDFTAGTHELQYRMYATHGSSNARYYDASGALLGSQDFKYYPGSKSGIYDTYAFTASAGKTIAYMTISIGTEGTGDSGVLIDEIKWSNLQIPKSASFALTPEDPPLDSGADVQVLSHAPHAFVEHGEVFIGKLGFADRLEGGAGNDTFSNVGTADVAHGGAGDDAIHILSGDFERIDGGLGIDTLVMDGKAMHIDLSAFGLKVQGFEKFDLGAGGNTLALSANDVLANGVRDMATTDGKVQMLVNGANGEVNLLGGNDDWAQGGNATVGGVTYSVYSNLAGTAELLVEDKVHVTIL